MFISVSSSVNCGLLEARNMSYNFLFETKKYLKNTESLFGAIVYKCVCLFFLLAPSRVTWLAPAC